MNTSLRVGTRPSRLALLQVEEVTKRFSAMSFTVVPIATKGDKDKSTPLRLEEGTDFFTYEVERALINNEIDVAVHSAKDLEEAMPGDLTIAARTKPVSVFDCLVSRNNVSLSELPAGSHIGTSSKNRQEALLRYRPDCFCLDIRGTIEERLLQLDKGIFDAVIIAHAALLRLGLRERSTQIFPFSIIRPHPLQGRLAIQVHKSRDDLIELFGSIDGN